MNVSFWGAMLAMLLVAIAMLVLPLLKVRKSHSIAAKASNIQLHTEKLEELDVDLQEGRINQVDYKIARQELDRELLEDIPAESQETAAQHYTAEAKKNPALALAIAVFIPALSLLVYMQLGMHADAEQESAEVENKVASIAEMVVQLEQYLKENKGEFKDWVMLGRTYKHLGRYGESANAYTTAGTYESNPQVMLEHAEVLALVNNQQFNDEARELVLKALALAPDNVNTILFAGVVESQFGNYRESIDYLSRLAQEAAQDAEVNKTVRFYISQARQQLIAAGEEVATIDELLPPSQNVPVNLVSLQVSVDVSEEIRKNFSATDTVFVYAKALQGPKMPLAAMRLTLADLPATVVLDDSMGMVEGMNLSAFKQVVVSARISKAGTAIAKSGDYIGTVTVDDVASAAELNISIETVIP